MKCEEISVALFLKKMNFLGYWKNSQLITINVLFIKQLYYLSKDTRDVYDIGGDYQLCLINCHLLISRKFKNSKTKNAQ